MRLIDADKIEFVLPRTLTEEEKKTYGLVIKKAFNNAPTVDAIPIKWMEEYADLNRFTTPDGQVIIKFRWIVDEMVADWREALEVQSNE